ncbi:pilus assembly PilX family protein [Ectothiorhodospira mobilis]|uniref:pilus assembly PilX family protein n=1 Tax=Ectothiorhodospira mobilis TaxID=195064 RepID=UPI001EE78309|nr:PilX N-terminal domain-containing pilus assembly protein [Ectothiorhodospira mobilis]MCG5534646.1 PilX N-terminal domain-containing pilus assembly protein [Ectothiorhodospira mobilis]
MSPRTLCTFSRPRQRGAVLAVSLIFLLLLTLLGVTTMQSTLLQERMAGSFRDRDLAFQAAEAGLRDAEEWVEGLTSTATLTGTGGRLGEDDVEPDYLAIDWTSDQSFACGEAVTGVAATPRCIVKHLGHSAQDSSPTPNTTYGNTAAGPQRQHFVITVHAVGGTGEAEAILRSRYVTLW